jgi:cell division protein FtsB
MAKKKLSGFKKFILPHLKNKYVMTILIFFVWLSFFDRNDFIIQHRYNKNLRDLQKELKYYNTQIDKSKKEYEALMTNPNNLEKFAREHYYMKKDNEDIFVIVKEDKHGKVLADKR